MEEFLIYLFKVLILQTMLFTLYWFSSRRASDFHFNRLFLLGILVIPLVAPFLKIPVYVSGSDNISTGLNNSLIFVEQSVPEIIISDTASNQESTSWWKIVIPLIYVAISIVLIAKFIISYLQIYRLTRRSKKKEISPNGFKLFYVSIKIPSFSFINKIFLSDEISINPKEKESIIAHEEYHLKEWHSLDIIISEFIRILFWFNPIINFLQNQLKQTHEYLADRHTVTTMGESNYTSLLNSFKQQEIRMVLGSSYSSSSIKKRIQMIEKPEKRQSIYRLSALIIIALFTVFAFSCEDKLDSLENIDDSTQNEVSGSDLQKEVDRKLRRLKNAPEDFLQEYKALQLNNPDIYYEPFIIVLNENGPGIDKIVESKSSLFGVDHTFVFSRKLNKKETSRYYSDKGFISQKIKSGKSYALIRIVDRAAHLEHRKKVNWADASIHTQVDKVAEFQGGQSGLTEYLRENLRYPELAKEKGIECNLIMSFVVNFGGGLVYLNIVKEPNISDEEISLEFQIAAYQALKATEGKWKPAEKNGKYVMSRITLPIEFELDN